MPQSQISKASSSVFHAELASKHPGEGLVATRQWKEIGARFGLTHRELSVAKLMFEGKSRYLISRQLNCAPSTVRTYIDRLFAKLQVEDRLDMALRIVSVILVRQ